MADYDAMDCVAANVAVLVLLHGACARRALGSQWCFAFDLRADAGHPRLRLDRLSLAEQLQRLAGLRLSTHRLGDAPAEELARLVEDVGPLVVYGDAHGMPWSPLHGKEHIEHTFLVTNAADDGGLTVLDAYTNKTEHGEARPTGSVVDAATAAAAIDALDGATRRVALSTARSDGSAASPHALIVDNCKDVLGQTDALRRFASHYERAGQAPEAAKAFALECWLVARKRVLHERWLGDVGADLVPRPLVAAFREQVATPWQRVSELAYLAERRVRRGRSAPSAAFRTIEGLQAAESELATELLACMGGEP